MNSNALRSRLQEHCKKAGSVNLLREKLLAIGIQAPSIATLYNLLHDRGSDVTLSLLVYVCDREFPNHVNPFAFNNKTLNFKYSAYNFTPK